MKVPPFAVVIGQPGVCGLPREVVVEQCGAPLWGVFVNDAQPLVDYQSDTGIVRAPNVPEWHLHSEGSSTVDNARAVYGPVVR